MLVANTISCWICIELGRSCGQFDFSGSSFNFETTVLGQRHTDSSLMWMYFPHVLLGKECPKAWLLSHPRGHMHINASP